MNDSTYNILVPVGSWQPQPILTYADVLEKLGSQVMDRFLIIGIIILITSLWYIFDGHKREDKFSQELTGALNYLSLCAGLVSLIFWMIFKGWIKV